MNARTWSLPRRVDGLDARRKAIFEQAFNAAYGKHSLESATGATATWRRRRNGLTLRVESSVSLPNNVHVLDVTVRWKRATVFRARYSQLLFSRGPERLRSATVVTDAPGDWESALSDARRVR